MVSVLMTDLVGSTAMADRLGPAEGEALRTEHFELLRGALEQTGGREVKNLGDGLMVVFSSASQSMSCASHMQQAVEARNRRSKEPLGVRIGVSLGDTTVEDGDHFGEPVVEASRLCAAAEGGQILVSDLVRQVGGARDGYRFRSLGGLQLKGLAEPVQAFELGWEPAVGGRIALPGQLSDLPPTGYVGRQAERAVLEELWGQARGGSIRLALIGGEAGMGKTRLSTHLAFEAHGEGAMVLYGRCDEDLGVPYQPWVQALRHLVAEAPQALLRTHVDRHGGELARLLPTLGDRVPGLPQPRQSDPETERYLLYGAAAGLLEEAGESDPLVLILDDLHWADAPTLSLLRHVVTTGASMRVLVVGTYRDSDLSHGHPLAALLADLHREQGVERIKLTGLETGDVLALMEAVAGHELDENGRALAQEIARETAGNPFFAGELLRHLAESGATVQEDSGRWQLVGNVQELGLPQSVREVIGRRVERLGPDARTALSAAAVIGLDFDLDLLVSVVEFDASRLLDLLEEAVAASLLQEGGERAGRFTFTHALVEHTLYEDLGRTRRARLHQQVAEALEELCGEEPGERLGELAAHWAAAVISTDTAKALHYAQRAAERALAQLAPDEAVRWYRQALELQSQAAPRSDESERCELLIGLGEAQRQTGDPSSRETLLAAAQLAQELNDVDRLCRAVLANTRGFTSQLGMVDNERVAALEAAVRALPDEENPQRGRVLALLANELHYSGDSSRSRQLAAEATEIARASADQITLARTLSDVMWAIASPDTLEQRRRLADELIDLTSGLDDQLRSRAAGWRVLTGLEAGDRSQIESGISTMRALAATVQPTSGWALLVSEATWSLVQGDLEASEGWAMQAAEAGTAAGEPDVAVVFGVQLFAVRLLQGRLAELVEPSLQLTRRADTVAGHRPGAALALIAAGRFDEARELALAEDLSSISLEQAWSIAMVLWAMVCSRLGIVERADELYELLVPFSGQMGGNASTVFGSVDWALGTLAVTLERYEEANGHFAAAAEIEERVGAPLFLARTHVSWARTLIDHGRPEDLDRAQFMLERAEGAATRLGPAGIGRDIAECRAALVATGG